jgi:CubicO group peptidase (beta-lactamase class C family)
MKYIYIVIVQIVIVHAGYAQDIKKIDSLFQKSFESGEFNGNVLISKGGEVLFNKSYGLSNFKTKEPLTDKSIFNLASISKQFTAAGIVLLMRDGKINLDDPVKKYIPELSFYPTITIDHLLHHTSGLASYMQLADSLLINENKNMLIDNNDVIELFEKAKPELHFEPNEKYEYSNTGYLLLATIIERVSKQSFSAYLNQNIFTPLEMKDTKVLFRYAEPTHIENLTNGYEENEKGELVESIITTPEMLNFDLVKGQGRVYSTVLDLNKWSNAIDNHFFTKSELNLISAIGKTENEEQLNYGLGWYIKQDIIHGKSLYHSGSWPGYVTYIQKDLELNLTTIILQNVSTSKTTIPTYSLSSLLYGKVETNLDADYLQKLSGKYITPNNSEKTILYEDGKLYALQGPSMKMELLPRSKTIFKVKDFSPEVNFEFIVEKGVVKGYDFYQLNLGKKSNAQKVE